MEKIVTTRKYYTAKLRTVTVRQGKNGPYMMWEFEATSGQRLVGFTDAEIELGNRTWCWLEMLGVALKVGDTVELEDLFEIECTVFTDDKGTVRMVSKKNVESKPTESPIPQEIKEVKQTAEGLFG